MTALLRDVPRSGWRSRQAGGCDRGLQKQLIGPVPPPLRCWMADRLAANHPLLPLHGPLREDETLSEQRRQRRAARGQTPTALGAGPEPTGLAGSGKKFVFCEQTIFVVFCCILVSLILQGTTLAPLIRRFDLTDP